MAATRLVVVGANAAGMSAAHQALRGARARGRDLAVVVLEQTDDTSYSACGIPYWIAGDLDDPDDLVARSADRHREMGVDLRLGATVTAVDLTVRLVRYREAQGERVDLSFDELVLATGASAVVPDWARHPDGQLVIGAHPVKDLDDGAQWLGLLDSGSTASGDAPYAAAQPRKAVILGGGYIGIEMAEAMVRRGLETTLVTRSHVMSRLDPDMSARIRARLEAANIDVQEDTEVTSLSSNSDGSVHEVVTADGRALPADVVVLGVGETPNTAIGARAGLPVGESGGYLPDPRGRLVDGVWAAGDCCEAIHRLTGRFAFIPLGTHANKQGRIVGENVSGGDATFGGVLGTAITRFVAGTEYVEIARTGLSTSEAEAAWRKVAGLVTEGTTASGYMPEATPIATKVLAEPGTRLLLGVQIVGGRSAGKRIDTAATAIWGGMTVDDLAGMDLSYAPPFARLGCRATGGPTAGRAPVTVTGPARRLGTCRPSARQPHRREHRTQEHHPPYRSRRRNQRHGEATHRMADHDHIR